MNDQNKIIIYCDGGCRGNQSKENIGGWGAILKNDKHEKQIYGGEKNTTNNRMELIACIKALECLKKFNKPIEIYSDSAYLINCMTQKWYIGWRKNGWKNSKKKPVENRDLWEQLLNLIDKFENIKFNKVAGHQGVELNELVDGLANKSMDELEHNN